MDTSQIDGQQLDRWIVGVGQMDSGSWIDGQQELDRWIVGVGQMDSRSWIDGQQELDR